MGRQGSGARTTAAPIPRLVKRAKWHRLPVKRMADLLAPSCKGRTCLRIEVVAVAGDSGARGSALITRPDERLHKIERGQLVVGYVEDATMAYILVPTWFGRPLPEDTSRQVDTGELVARAVQPAKDLACHLQRRQLVFGTIKSPQGDAVREVERDKLVAGAEKILQSCAASEAEGDKLAVPAFNPVEGGARCV